MLGFKLEGMGFLMARTVLLLIYLILTSAYGAQVSRTDFSQLREDLKQDSDVNYLQNFHFLNQYRVYEFEGIEQLNVNAKRFFIYDEIINNDKSEARISGIFFDQQEDLHGENYIETEYGHGILPVEYLVPMHPKLDAKVKNVIELDDNLYRVNFKNEEKIT